MFSVCGSEGATMTPLFRVFDMVELSWTNSYDPNQSYSIPQSLAAVIGGKYEMPPLLLVLSSSICLHVRVRWIHTML